MINPLTIDEIRDDLKLHSNNHGNNGNHDGRNFNSWKLQTHESSKRQLDMQM
jgi:hypothetical protein